MKNITIKQHYIPQFYLKWFTDEKKCLHCYNKHSGEYFHAKTEDVCRKSFLYETEYSIPLKNGEKYILKNHTEKMFSKLESKYNAVVKKILNKCLLNFDGKSLICNQDEKSVLANMVSNFIIRNPNAVYSFINPKETDYLLKSEEIKPYTDVFETLGFGEPTSLIVVTQKEVAFNPDMEGTAKKIIDDLMELDITFFVTKDRFITSDCPVLFDICDDCIVYAQLPLSPKVMAVYSKTKSSRKFRNKAFEVDTNIVLKFNTYQLNSENTKMLISTDEKDIINIL